MVSRSKLSEAEATLRRGLVNFPDSAVLYAGLGEVLQKKGQTDVALRAYRRAIELDPKNQIAIAAKGDLEKAQTVSARRTND
jgi:cytochrome c-type biogenesis protein CcmH/NrfG